MSAENSLLPENVSFETFIIPENRGVYASVDRLFRFAEFGRDSIEVAEEVLATDPVLCEAIILSLAQKQAISLDDGADSRPGKIMHEHRERPPESDDDYDSLIAIFSDVSRRFAGSEEEVTYYGSVDSTPLFVRLIGRYCDRYGPRILHDTEITRADGRAVTLQECLQDAVSCIASEIDDSPFGLLSYVHRNPNGKLSQSWKDSDEFMVHLDGELANYADHVASIEVQGIAYDALIYGSHLIPGQAGRLKELATFIQQNTLFTHWIDQSSYFALGWDIGPNLQPRRFDTETANPMELLDTMIFDDLPESERRMFVSSLVNKAFGPDFLTDAGIRSRSLNHAGLVNFWDYHGSHVTWPKETYDIAKGLYRQGFASLGTELENRLHNVVARFNSYPEFIYLDNNGTALVQEIGGSTQESPRLFGQTQPVSSLNDAQNQNYTELSNVTDVNNIDKAEANQAWTFAAIYALLSRDIQLEPVSNSWQNTVEQKILQRVKQMPRVRSREELDVLYPLTAFRLTGSPRATANSFYQYLAAIQPAA